MIICCEKCDTKYRLDASMISTSAVKVQCSKCSHIFIVPAANADAAVKDLQAAQSPPTPDFTDSPNENNYHGEDFETSEENQEEFETKPDINSEETPKSEAEADDAVDSSPSLTSNVSFTSPDENRTTETEPQDETAAEQVPEKSDTTTETEAEAEADTDSEKEMATDADTPAERANLDTEDSGESTDAIDDKKPTKTYNSSAFDLTFNAPEESPSLEDVRDGDTDKKTISNDETPAEVTTKETESSTRSDEGSQDNDNISPRPFDISFNSAEKDHTKDMAAKEEFHTFIASDTKQEPMAKYYIDKAKAEGAHKKETLQAPEDTTTTPGINSAINVNAPSFGSELSQAQSEAENSSVTEIPREYAAPQTPTSESAFTPPEKPAMTAVNKSSPTRIISLIIIILVIAGGIIYIKTKPQSALMATPSKEQSIEIETTKGYYVMNKEGGRIFVIESMIRNMSEKPLKISGIRGLVLNSSGEEMASRRVSPGRIVSAVDLRTMPVEKLLRSFRDTSEGTIPQRATIPTMILFPDLGEAVAEYGIDVLR